MRSKTIKTFLDNCSLFLGGEGCLIIRIEKGQVEHSVKKPPTKFRFHS
jgi:hypothetical protein